MNKYLLSTVLLLISISVQAQTARSGINNQSPTVTLDVTGNPTNKSYLDGIVAPKITGAQLSAKTYTTTENGAIVYVTTADPAPAGQTINVTTPGYYYFNFPTSTWIRIVGGAGGPASTGQVLTADANGFGRWQAVAITAIGGTLPATSPSFTNYTTNTMATNASITLAPGKWMVAFGTTSAISTVPNQIITTDGSLWCTLYISDVATGSGAVGVVTPDLITNYSGIRGAGGDIGRGMNQTFVSGCQAVNNTSGANKTYYIWASMTLNGTANMGASPAYWTNIFGTSNWERYFYAFPIQ